MSQSVPSCIFSISPTYKRVLNNFKRFEVFLLMVIMLYCWINGEYFKLLGGKIFWIPERRVKARKQGHLTIGGAFICRNIIG